jgi:hypothetical protein
MHLQTVCIRCGKLRIVAKTWKDMIGTTQTVFTQTVCPDSECQKIVEEMLKKRNDHANEIKNQSTLRRSINIKKRRTNIVLKKH